ncbi:MAG: EthD family reductase [Halolamina sp.]|uniref:EthD family reductase n=1 Tax=Halolamina sp. TaxID=1940283 RepID=UPI002FC348BF
MVKMVALLVREDSLSHEEFATYWEEEHAPLVDDLPNVQRYVTSLPTDPEESAYDGLAELYFEDMAALGAAFDSAAGEALLEDAAEFSDQEAGDVLYMEETEQL